MRQPDESHSTIVVRPAGVPWRAVLAAQALALGVVAGLAALAHAAGVPFAHVSRDPATALGGPFVTGYLSYLGACLWCAAGAVALFSAVLARGGRDHVGAAFFLATGLLSGLMLADDLFMVHDGLVTQLLGGDVERWNLVLYALLAGAYLLAFAPLVRRTCLPLLAAAGCAFAGSVLVDAALIPVAESRRHLTEDGCKFLGIANWAAWVTSACLQRLRATAAGDPRLAHDGPTSSKACSPSR